jgi:hypothetical protein
MTSNNTFVRWLGCLSLLVLVVVAGSVSAADQPIELKLSPAKGQVQKLQATLTQKVTQTISGTEQALSQTIALGYTFATQDVAADGTATVKVTYDTVSFKQTSQVGNIEYDSANPPPPGQIHPMARGFAALAGQSFTMKVTPTGKITEIQGLDQMVDAILKKLDIAEGPAKPIAEKAIRHDFGEEALKDNMEGLLAIYPDKPVSLGDSWTKKLSVSKGFPMLMENNFTLKEATPSAATLAVKSKLSTNPDAPPIDMRNQKITYTLTGEQTGTMVVDRGSGWVKSADMTQKVTGEMVTDAGAGRIAKTPMTVETRVVLEGK